MATAINWPSTVPARPSVRGFNQVGRDNVVRSKPDFGPSKTRRRYTADTIYYSCQYEMTLGEWAYLEAFYWSTVASGTLSFNWVHPLTGTSTEVMFFGGPPSHSPLTPLVMVVSFVLEKVV
jgi:hypothetical protein